LKRPIFLAFIAASVAFVSAQSVSAQQILTADKYFDKISQNYAQINDYEADIAITQLKNTMKGVLYYKKPDLMRIDFSEPKDQVIVSDGTKLTIYIPKQSAVFQQTLQKGTQTTSAPLLANEEGLQLLKKNYSIAYLESPTPVALDKGSTEMVIKLKLEWRSTGEGFRQLELDIGDKSGLIRRIIGVSATFEKTQFDFTNIKTNQNIPQGRFKYEPPQTANIYPNFLFVPQS
jgi:outer membrane lipoprotein-sorting protein